MTPGAFVIALAQSLSSDPTIINACRTMGYVESLLSSVIHPASLSNTRTRHSIVLLQTNSCESKVREGGSVYTNQHHTGRTLFGQKRSRVLGLR